MHQTEYAISILQQFGMEHCFPSETPLPKGTTLSKDSATPLVDTTLYRMLVGKLIFLTKTRLDITHVVSVVSRFMQNPQEVHLQAAKPEIAIEGERGRQEIIRETRNWYNMQRIA